MRWPPSARRSERCPTASPVYLVKGDDASLVAQGVRALLDEMVGDGDHALVVEEIGGGAGRRVERGRRGRCLPDPALPGRPAGRRGARGGPAADRRRPRLVEVVQDPLPSTVLVLVGGGGTVPAPLVKAVKAAGQVIDVTTGKAGERKAWLHDHLRAAPVKLEPRAADLLAGHVGEDLGRVEGLLGALSAAYGEGARITADDLAPYLGEAGNVPRYELTDAIDKGEPGRRARSCSTACSRRAAWPRCRCSPRCTATSPTCWPSTATTS